MLQYIQLYSIFIFRYSLAFWCHTWSKPKRHVVCYSELCMFQRTHIHLRHALRIKTSKMDVFAKIIEVWKPVTIFATKSILDIWLEFVCLIRNRYFAWVKKSETKCMSHAFKKSMKLYLRILPTFSLCCNYACWAL